MSRSLMMLAGFALVACGGSQTKSGQAPLPTNSGESAVAEERLPCGASSTQELAELVVASLRTGDASQLACAYVVLTDEPSRGGCFKNNSDQAMFEEMFAAKRNRCGELLGLADWSTIKLTSVSGGEAIETRDVCDSPVEFREDLVVGLESDSGARTIKIDDVLAFDGRLGLTADLLVCEGPRESGAETAP